jgi:hypothetical protein
MGSVIAFISVGDYSSPRPSANQAHPAAGDTIFADIPQSKRNVDRLAPLLSRSLALPSPPTIKRLEDPADSDEMAKFIATTAEEADDLLLLYYCGHGVITSQGTLGLTRKGSLPAMSDYDTLDFERVRTACRRSPARMRIVILDCCYSGAAAQDLLSDDNLRGRLAINGSYVVTSAPATRPAHVVKGEQYTAFTGELIRILEQDGEPGDVRSWNDVTQKVRTALLAAGFPEPQVLDQNQVGDRPLLRRVPLMDLDSDSTSTAAGDGYAQFRERTGLAALYTDINDEDNRAIAQRIRNSKRIVFSAHTGYNAMVSQYQPAMRAAIEAGATLEVVVTDPDASFMSDDEVVRRLCPSIRQQGEIHDVIAACARHQRLAVARGLPASNVQLRLYIGCPSTNLLLTDQALRVIPYLPLLDAGESPVFDFAWVGRSPPEIVAKYLEAIARQWQDARPIDLAAWAAQTGS